MALSLCFRFTSSQDQRRVRLIYPARARRKERSKRYQNCTRYWRSFISRCPCSSGSPLRCKVSDLFLNLSVSVFVLYLYEDNLSSSRLGECWLLWKLYLLGTAERIVKIYLQWEAKNSSSSLGAGNSCYELLVSSPRLSSLNDCCFILDLTSLKGHIKKSININEDTCMRPAHARHLRCGVHGVPLF